MSRWPAISHPPSGLGLTVRAAAREIRPTARPAACWDDCRPEWTTFVVLQECRYVHFEGPLGELPQVGVAKPIAAIVGAKQNRDVNTL